MDPGYVWFVAGPPASSCCCPELVVLLLSPEESVGGSGAPASCWLSGCGESFPDWSGFGLEPVSSCVDSLVSGLASSPVAESLFSGAGFISSSGFDSGLVESGSVSLTFWFDSSDESGLVFAAGWSVEVSLFSNSE